MHSARWVVLLACWVGAIACGLGWLMNYQSTAGASGPAVIHWPVRALSRPEGGHPCLVMAIHPKCPCSRASLAEVEEVLAGVGSPLDVRLLACTPTSSNGDAWDTSDLNDWAARVSGSFPFVNASVVSDLGGHIAAAFGMKTSGHVALYGPSGQQLFTGGVTASRGQVGPNSAAAALTLALRNTGAASTLQTQRPVFGCALVAEMSCPLCGAQR